MFAENLKKLRKEKGLSQEEMAAKLNVVSRTYGSWERNEREPDFSTLCKIADFFGVSTDYILGRVPMDVEIKKETPPELPEGVQEIRAVVSAAADQPQLDAALEAAVRRIVRQELHRQDSES
ncbi:MAG: helix-turn-helix transcriptional regulator [Eubacteriales bacterium]|nr:helix-turn-helix transcriptional regulator [Eubacteriales bacterium]